MDPLDNTSAWQSLYVLPLLLKMQPKSHETEVDEALTGVIMTRHTVTPSNDDINFV